MYTKELLCNLKGTKKKHSYTKENQTHIVKKIYPSLKLTGAKAIWLYFVQGSAVL